MPYSINPAELSELFAVPARVADRLIKLSGAIQLKVLLVALRQGAQRIEPEAIAEKLSISTPDVTDALNYWVECGILQNAEMPADIQPNIEKPEKKKTIKIEIEKPDRNEVVKRGNESPEVAFMFREAQLKLGRPLRPNESSTLLWLHDSEGFTVPIILLLITFAVNEGKPNVGFIERTALSWIKDEVTTVDQAEKKIADHHARKSAWGRLCSAMGIENRMPSTKEAEYAYKWTEEYGYNNEILRLAYDTCVDSAGKFSLAYISKIIENWHKNGVKTTDDINKLNEGKNTKETKKKTDSFDLDSYNKSLDELPE